MGEKNLEYQESEEIRNLGVFIAFAASLIVLARQVKQILGESDRYLAPGTGRVMAPGNGPFK